MKTYLTLLTLSMSTHLFALNPKETTDLVKVVDEKQRNTGDYASTVLINQSEKSGSGIIKKNFVAQVYRRDLDDKWIILFTEPKTEAGKGYLRIDKNLFLYDPAYGKWERQTERASIGGTNSRRDDFDESRLSEEYESSFVADEMLGKIAVHRLKLIAKKDADVASSVLELWIDQKDKNILKREEFAKSGKLLRTSYYPTWEKRYSASKKAEVYIPQSIIIIDQVEKGNETKVKLENVSLDSLPENMFTKPWIETKSRK